MHQLPVEVFHLIFRGLNFNQLLVCRLVCKNWRYAVQGYLFRIRSLAICRRVDLPNKGVHFLSHVPINESTAAHVRNLNFLKIEMFRAILSRLRCLYVDFVIKGFQNFYLYINECQQLEQLQIDNFARQEMEINLPSLRIMCVQDQIQGYCNYNLILNTPNLFAFKCSGQFSFIHFSYPTNITHLCLFEKFNDLIRIFVNLRYLYVTFTGLLYSPPFDLSQVFPELEEFHFLSLRDNFMQNLLKRTSKDRWTAPAPPKMKLICAGHPVKTIDEYYRFSRPFVYRCDNAYSLWENYADTSNFVPWVREINFCSMLACLSEVPRDFFNKFVNIKKVHLNQAIYRIDQLVYFLSNCRVLNELHMSGSLLPETFFQSLPGYCPFLVVLEINEPFPIKNLRFLLKFDYLRWMRIEQDTSKNVVLRMIRKETIKYFAFHFGKEKFTFKKTERTLNYDYVEDPKSLSYTERFEICSPTNNVSFDTLDELVGFLRTVMINPE